MTRSFVCRVNGLVKKKFQTVSRYNATVVKPPAMCQFVSAVLNLVSVHLNVQESMGKSCKYMQFMKHTFVSHTLPHLNVCAMKSKVCRY